MVKNKLKIIAILSVLVCVGLSILFLNGAETYKFKEDAHYVFYGVESVIEKGAKATIQDDGNIQIKTVYKEKMDLTTFPAVFDDNRIVVMNRLSIYTPIAEGKFNKKKLNSFTEIEYNSKTTFATLSKNGKDKQEQRGFLFDGHNTYVFLEETKVTVEDKTYTVKPLSIATVEYENWIQLYDYSSKEIIEVYTREDVFAENKDGLYKINLSRDTVTYSGENTLMIADVNALKDYFLGD